ncbi:MAG: transketolase [Acidimicrobiia bacterium]
MNTEQLSVNTIKALSMDAIERSNSGHPGAPMGMADIAVVLWTRYLRVDPADAVWPNRDRFVLSNGHASMLLYSLLHLSGFGVTLDDIKAFRRLGSPTPGHPEREPHLGIETTTGPLGQGFGTAIGMAIAERHLSALFGDDLVDHRTFAFVSDGDLMEGIASEAASLAGHLGLGKAIFFFDDNGISLDGPTDWIFTEDVAKRFDAYGWHTVSVDGHDRAAIAEATDAALAVGDQPSLLLCRTHIGHGAPTKQDTSKAHGSPLGTEEVAAAKVAMGWPVDEPFLVPAEVSEFFASAMQENAAARRAWEASRDSVFAGSPEVEGLWGRYHSAPAAGLDVQFSVGESIATRAASGKALNALAVTAPGLIGGSADLSGSTNTNIDGSDHFGKETPTGRNIYFGVREHGMGAIVNGITVHGGLRGYGGTFLVFSDYMRGAVRVGALMGAPSIWVFTHDSVFLGEDGPTHQPVEHLAALRSIPNLWVIRPGDATETVEAWEMAYNRTDGPSALVLTRQGLPVLDRPAGGVQRGGYVLTDGSDVTIIATGSEVWVALEAADILAANDISARVVSMPCVEAFDLQDEEYRTEVLGTTAPRVSIEAGVTDGWHRIVGNEGLSIGIDRFGLSAPWKDIATELGFTSQGVAERVMAWLGT